MPRFIPRRLRLLRTRLRISNPRTPPAPPPPDPPPPPESTQPPDESPDDAGATETGADPAPVQDRERADHRPGTRPIALVLLVAVLLGAGLAMAGWYEVNRAQRAERARRDAAAAAPAAVTAILSYDHRRFDEDTAAGRRHATGPFETEYADSAAALRATAYADHTVVTAEVIAVSVVHATPDRVELLVFVNQHRHTASTDRLDAERLLITMVPADGTWKIANVTGI